MLSFACAGACAAHFVPVGLGLYCHCIYPTVFVCWHTRYMPCRVVVMLLLVCLLMVPSRQLASSWLWSFLKKQVRPGTRVLGGGRLCGLRGSIEEWHLGAPGLGLRVVGLRIAQLLTEHVTPRTSRACSHTYVDSPAMHVHV